MRKLPDTLTLLFIIVSAIILLIGAILLWNFTIDDSFITYRYAENLVNGHIFQWNKNESPVEGYTTFLWLLILGISFLLNIEITIFSKLLGIIFMFCTALASIGLLQQLFNNNKPLYKYLSLFPMLVLLIYPESSVHAISGMETSLFTFLLSLYLFVFCSLTNDYTRKKANWLLLTGLLLGLTRPEGNLIVLVSIISSLFLTKKFRHVDFVSSLFIIYLLPGAIYFILRIIYFGHLLPTSFYIKVILTNIPGASGWQVFLNFIEYNLIIIIIAIAGCFNLKKSQIPILLAIASFLFFYIFPKHIMGYCFRFLYPSLPFILTLFVFGLNIILKMIMKRTKGISFFTAIFLVCCALIVQSHHIVVNWKKTFEWTKQYAQGMQQAHIPLGKLLREIDNSGNKKVALQDAGAISFFSNWIAIDIIGLNNEFLAYEDYDLKKIIDEKPDVVIMNSYNKQFYKHWGWDHELYNGFLIKGMSLAKIYTFKEGKYYLFVLAYPGTRIWNLLINNS